MQLFLLQVAKRDVDPRPTHQPVASQLHCSAALSADSNFSRAKPFNSSYSLTRRTPNVLCSSITCEHDLRQGLGGEYRQDRLLVRSGVAVPSCISNPPNILTTTVTSATLFQRDIQMHISKTRTWCWVWGNWGILIRNRLKVVSAKRSNVERVCDNGENSLLRLFIYKYLGIINICIRQI